MQIRGQIETNGQFLPGIVKKSSDAGFYLSSRPNMRRNLSELAQRSRQEQGRLAVRWKHELTASQQIAWQSFAAGHPITTPAGDTKTLNGQQYFQMVNHRKFTARMNQSNNPPSNANPGKFTFPQVRILAPGFLGITFRNQDPWTKRPTSRCVIIDNGPQNQTAGYTSRWGRAAFIFPGIPQIGYPTEVFIPRPYAAATETAASIKTYVVDDDRPPTDEEIGTTGPAPSPPPPVPCSGCTLCAGSIPFPLDPTACPTPRKWHLIATATVNGETNVIQQNDPCEWFNIDGPPNLVVLDAPSENMTIQLSRLSVTWRLRAIIATIPPQIGMAIIQALPGDCTIPKLFIMTTNNAFLGSVWIATPEPIFTP